MNNSWMTCPVCGTQAVITEGAYLSYLTGARSETPPEGLGSGEWAIWGLENDTLHWPEPCPGYLIKMENGQRVIRHLTAEEAWQ